MHDGLPGRTAGTWFGPLFEIWAPGSKLPPGRGLAAGQLGCPMGWVPKSGTRSRAKNAPVASPALGEGFGMPTGPDSPKFLCPDGGFPGLGEHSLS